MKEVIGYRVKDIDGDYWHSSTVCRNERGRPLTSDDATDIIAIIRRDGIKAKIVRVTRPATEAVVAESGVCDCHESTSHSDAITHAAAMERSLAEERDKAQADNRELRAEVEVLKLRLTTQYTAKAPAFKWTPEFHQELGERVRNVSERYLRDVCGVNNASRYADLSKQDRSLCMRVGQSLFTIGRNSALYDLHDQAIDALAADGQAQENLERALKAEKELEEARNKVVGVVAGHVYAGQRVTVSRDKQLAEALHRAMMAEGELRKFKTEVAGAASHLSVLAGPNF